MADKQIRRFNISLTSEQSDQLEREAEKHGTTPTRLAGVWVKERLAGKDEEKAVVNVVKKLLGLLKNEEVNEDDTTS